MSLVPVPLSGGDVSDLLNGKTKIITYPELNKYESIGELLEPYGNVVILYLNTPNSGHWTTLFKYPNEPGIEFFDPYAMIPDHEFKFIDNREELGEEYAMLSRLLLEYSGPIEYNDNKFQRFAKNINTCGRWVVLRLLLRSMSLEEFKKFFMTIPKELGIDRDKLVAHLIN